MPVPAASAVEVAPSRPPDGCASTGLLADLARARSALHEARLVPGPDDRFLAAHLVALRVAAVVLSAGSGPGRRRRPRNAWRAVAETVPALAGWASAFASTEDERDAVRAGATGVVSAAQADEVVGDTGRFLDVVEDALTRGARPATSPAGPAEGGLPSLRH